MTMLATDPHAVGIDAEAAALVKEQQQQQQHNHPGGAITDNPTHGDTGAQHVDFGQQQQTTAHSPTLSDSAMCDDRRGSTGSLEDSTKVPLSKRDRRLSKEWDAAKTPPSRFQKVEGSIFATPASRDGHVARNKIHGFKEKVAALSGKKS